jgi:thioesterase III
MTNKIFHYPVTIKEGHLDTFGHVNNAVYLALLEEARWDLLNQGNFGIKKIQASGLGPTILEIKISFKRELHLHDKIIIETQMLSYKKKIGVLLHRIIRNDKVCCTAEYIMGLFCLNERKLIAPTPEWLSAIGYVGERQDST